MLIVIGVFDVIDGLAALFTFKPAFPLWSILISALDVVIVYALAARWQEAELRWAVFPDTEGGSMSDLIVVSYPDEATGQLA